MPNSVEFVVLLRGGTEHLVTCDPNDTDVVAGELFPDSEVDMIYRHVEEEENARCSAIYPLQHQDSWWEGWACTACGEP